jgi:hypothetical protein
MKEFAIETVLSVTTGLLLTGIDDVYKILNYMTGDELFTHQLPRAARQVKPELLKQHPALGNDDLKQKISKLEQLIEFNRERKLSNDEMTLLIKGWLGTHIYPTYKETLHILPLHPDDYKSRNPVEEFASMLNETN